jgi:hypothetical protein
MKKPTIEEMVTFVTVREYLRWERPALEPDLDVSDDLFKKGDDSVTFGFKEGTDLWGFYVNGYHGAARALLEGPQTSFFWHSPSIPCYSSTDTTLNCRSNA